MISFKYAGWALLPLGLFIFLFLGTGIYFQLQGVEYAFYQLPAPVAILPAILVALWLNNHLVKNSGGLDGALSTFIKGMGNENVITMCLIYLLAGAFASVADKSGGVQAVVSMGLDLVPTAYLVAGMFVMSSIIATAMGTSMGTIGAVAPIAFGVLDVTGIHPATMAGAVIGGAMFGDNLSFISDTTIAATKTQGAELKDKFKENLVIALPAAILVLFIYIVFSASTNIEPTVLGLSHVAGEELVTSSYNVLLALPYFCIIFLAIIGVNVFAVLLTGIVLSLIAGTFAGEYQAMSIGQDVYAGFTNMQEIFLLSLLIGGLSELMKQQGGLDFLLKRVIKLLSKLKSVSDYYKNQLVIGVLGMVSNFAIANNTVAIIVTGEMSKQLAMSSNIEPKRSASILDIFTCIAQGLVPYGAQVLLTAAVFELSPIEVVSHAWYSMALFCVTLLIMFGRKSR